MNILYIAHRIPYPPTTGDKVRSFHQIQYLSRRHTVHLVCLADEKADLQHVDALRKHCEAVDVVYRNDTIAKYLAIVALFSKRSLSVAAFYSNKLLKRIAQKLSTEKFDRIIVFSSAMAKYVRHTSEIPKVMDFVDVDSEKWRCYTSYHSFPFSWIYRMEADRLAQFEEEVARAFDYSILVSEKEAKALRRRVRERPIAVIPNGVDLEYFSPRGDDSSSMHPPIIIFTGAMDYFPNIDAVRYFCHDIFPLIRRALPAAEFYIVGRKPTRQVRVLSRQPGVIVTGGVPDVRPYLGQAKVAVAPLRIARGIQNKVLEAMAMGLPVVGTSEVFEGIQATVADGIRIADDPKEFARTVLTLLEDPALRHHCALQSRSYVQRHHSWSNHGARLESLLHAMIGESSSQEAIRQTYGLLG